VQDSDEAVGEAAECVVVLDAAGAELVVEDACAGRAFQGCEGLGVERVHEPGALVFPGVRGGPIRRCNFNRMSAWPQAVASIGMPGLHFHDLRHTGNQFAANSGAGLRDLMARMGHDSERAAMIYQHEARGADKAITDAIDTHVEDEKRRNADAGGATGTVS